jgi:hypothetical protein
MKNKVIISPGLINAQDYIEYIDNKYSSIIVRIILFDDKSGNENSNHSWDQVRPISQVYYLKKSLELNWGSLKKDRNQILSIYKKIHQSSTSFFLSERSFFYTIFRSCPTHLPELLTIVANCVVLLNEDRPDKIIFVLRPHNLYFWILAFVAEQMGIKVLIVEFAPLTNSVWITKGLNELVVNISNTKTDEDAEKIALENFLDASKLGASKAHNVDTYKSSGNFLLKRIFNKLTTDKIFTLKKLLSIIFSEVKRSFFIRYYQNISSTTNLDLLKSKKIVTFFLHYQPESTTLPAGNEYNNQLAAILELSLNLPDGWSMLVKEHPSTFGQEWPLSNSYRSYAFYNFIKKIDNCYLLPMKMDLNFIVGISDCVATVTGTIGIQALSAGKKVIVFGNAAYRGAPYILDLTNSKLPKDAISEYLERDIFMSESVVLEYFKKIALNSFKDSNLDFNIQNFPREKDDRSAWILAVSEALRMC